MHTSKNKHPKHANVIIITVLNGKKVTFLPLKYVKEFNLTQMTINKTRLLMGFFFLFLFYYKGHFFIIYICNSSYLFI